MHLQTSLLGKSYSFSGVKELMAKANEEKSGDILAGIAAESETERVAAKLVLSECTLRELYENPAVPYEEDEVTRLGVQQLNQSAYARIGGMTVGEFREFLLRESPATLAEIRDGLTAEMIAGVTKLMSNMDLVRCARKLPVEATCNTTVGRPQTFSGRLQPNHPKDDIEGMLASIYEGLSYGVGDAVIGVNPASDSAAQTGNMLRAIADCTEKYAIPTQNCVLSHVTTQMEALKAGAPMDLMFQSLAGSEQGNRSFGISMELLDEAWELMRQKRHSTGPNFMYFETGQGSELSLNAHHGADQVTMEARCYTLAKRYKPFLVNTVVGFIGPEYLYNGKQTIRAGLEDHFMAKLTGLPMGVDCCHTNHMHSDQNDSDELALLVAAAGCNYIMGIPVADDIMLMNQTTSFHDIAAIREILDKRPIREFEVAMERLGIMEDGHLAPHAGDPSYFFSGRQSI